MDVLAALAWDPQIRGFLIVLTAVAILPGSVYLLLATNVGARIGFLLAVAGLTGWITIMGITWAFYGQGLKGRPPSWKVKEVVTAPGGDLGPAALPPLHDFPKGWKPLPKDNPELADAQAAADKIVTKSGRKPIIGHEGPIIKEPTEVETRYPAVFDSGEDYVVIGGYEKGGDNELFKIGHHKFFFRHSPHYVIVQLAPKIVPPAGFGLGGPPVKKVADPTKPVTSVIEVRDQGSLRFPPVAVATSSFLVFAITCHALHRRDKQIMAARATPVPVTA
jgi:hypothetical protein